MSDKSLQKVTVPIEKYTCPIEKVDLIFEKPDLIFEKTNHFFKKKVNILSLVMTSFENNITFSAKNRSLIEKAHLLVKINVLI
ncbi:hypothetical protein A4D02_06360 [Niastella koreensis]|uniref:Uncharacterized protein n=2 Tax=Niastella koreensis TaxID=354356 RepID=G8TG18_NIAKG|nr:hypothetical protein [Niastella koreensis]AEW01621.1 hypothetical protein Niako_5384 [Niastella koreensis GR20-10]OQP48335.1 hypothetical protein A4D02_06360 [Niastella koreensis]